jgi:uncharacterized membrane protein YedE/YeeE
MLDIASALDLFGDKGAAAIGGLIVGLLFGVSAQRSQFCLRSATIEFWRGSIGPKTAIWLLTFSAALFGVQALIAAGMIDTADVRQLSSEGTMSGAIIGGLLFGMGMILARGCASRLLVLSATGNLRALIAGLILTVVAQASLSGVLSPLRAGLSALWLVGPETRNMMHYLPAHTGLAAGVLMLALALILAFHRRLAPWTAVSALGVGGAVAAGWWYMSALAKQSFEPMSVESVSFTGPSADTLMALINEPSLPLGFGIGLVPGVFAGSLLASLVSGEFRIQSFNDQIGVPRYIAGACLMGFGAMLAGGCAVGAGVSGGSMLSLTAWVALTAMWVGAGLTDMFVDRAGAESLHFPAKTGYPSGSVS